MPTLACSYIYIYIRHFLKRVDSISEDRRSHPHPLPDVVSFSKTSSPLLTTCTSLTQEDIRKQLEKC